METGPDGGPTRRPGPVRAPAPSDAPEGMIDRRRTRRIPYFGGSPGTVTCTAFPAALNQHPSTSYTAVTLNQ
jgi:hypothetical protein